MAILTRRVLAGRYVVRKSMIKQIQTWIARKKNDVFLSSDFIALGEGGQVLLALRTLMRDL